MINNHHATENSEVKVLNGESVDDNFEIDLGVNSYVIRDSGGIDTLTFKDTKIENLEYSNRGGRAYIRDKKTQNVVTFDDSGYAERKRNVDKAYDSFNSTYQSIDMEKALAMESDTGITFRRELFEFHKLYDFYQQGRFPAALLSESVDHVNSKLDEMIGVADSRNNKNSLTLYTTIKTAFSDYTTQLIELDTNHATVIEKINVDGKIYDIKDVLISPALNNPYTEHPEKTPKNISELADITNIRMLKDNISDYTEKEVENLNDEIYSADTMIEYMAEFKDLGQELGIQRMPNYYDFNPMPNIVTVH
ncbi:hypothetical protein AB8989_08755 [Yersinia hibernica]|uniref:Uncharacterized protein n=1 Tax=Yersinia hibernica TaxID=2339259 RepID=A0ABX5R3D2_9GAMM|nr:hypothetical protein [Yersinia hibernica]QAX79858.1 hypothetical protein D5F51_15690 [Yersinia hibernica]